MKTKGKLPKQKNDYDIIGEQIALWKNQLNEFEDAYDLTDEQIEALAEMEAELTRLERAAVACNEVSADLYYGMKDSEIGTILEAGGIHGMRFDSIWTPFNGEYVSHTYLSNVEDDSELKELVANVAGYDAESTYQGYGDFGSY